MKVLLVDDDQSTGDSLTQAFTEENYVVNLVTDGETALKIARSCSYDLIVLNLISSHRKSLKICQILRREGYQGSIMMLSRQDAENAVIECDRGLDVGANACLPTSEDLHQVMTQMHHLLTQRSNAP